MPFSLTMPKLSPTMTEGKLVNWLKAEGDYVNAGEGLVEIGTDKATIEHQSIEPGYLRTILIKEGGSAAVGDVLAVLSETKEESLEGYTPERMPLEEEAPAAAPQKAVRRPIATPSSEPVRSSGRRVLASPLAKKTAKNLRVSLEGIRGTGPRGRIMSRDLALIKPAQSALPTIDIQVPEKSDLLPLTPMRETVAKRLGYSKMVIPHFYVTLKVDFSKLVALRATLKEQGSRITLNDFILKASATALMKHPQVRASFIPDQGIAQHHHADICVAVSIPGGLVTPILFEAETKSLHEISEAVKVLADKARKGALSPEEYTGGAFTISNMGMFGIEEFFAIINPPQVSILSVGSAVDMPVVRNGQIEVTKVVALTLAADHRALDGSDGAAFLKTMQALLEDPESLL